MWFMMAAAPGRPFDNVHVLGLPPRLDQFVLAPAMLLLCMLPIEFIVGLPLIFGWAGLFNLVEVATAIIIPLLGRAMVSVPMRRWMAPKGVRPEDLDRWFFEKPGITPRMLFRGLVAVSTPTGPTVLLLFGSTFSGAGVGVLL